MENIATLHNYNQIYGYLSIVYIEDNGEKIHFIAKQNVPRFVKITDTRYWQAIDITGNDLDYSNIRNKPTINGVEVEGNMTSNDLGIYSKPNSGIPESDLAPDVKSQLNKHFKGWYDSSDNLPANPVVGDYAYVKGATSSDPAVIYECNTAGTWSDSGRTVDTSNVQTFASGEEVNEVGIDDEPVMDSTNIVTSGGVYNQFNNTKDEVVDFPITIHKESSTNGYWGASSGTWQSDNTRRSTDKFSVIEGEKYYITTKIGSSTAIAYLAQWNNDTYIGVATGFTGGSGDVVDKQYVVPSGVTKIAIGSYNTTEPSVKKLTKVGTSKFYTKNEIDSLASPTYGVKWSTTNYDDLGERILGAVGKNAVIGVGNTNGYSDFDNIYPWSEMKRCNIKQNANGANIVTFEGETGFALDGSNGDVFVRIPKFKTNHYIKDGFEYITIGDGYVHPAFIEDGEELDEIFIGAFEASGDATSLFSKSGVIPANNYTGAEFLAAAKARGANYSLYDMRCVDALWRLMAVEYGCRNSNRIIGYGYADYYQAATYVSWSSITQAGTGVNTVVCGSITSNSMAIDMRSKFAAGNTICICDNDAATIIAERVITSVTAENGGNLSITFEGSPIDVTTSMFVGNAPAVCNYCETIDASYKLNWHTGMANRPPLPGVGLVTETMNPCRYRWIENPVGNVWHFLPDITFDNLQMYVCKSMKDYEMFKITAPYYPIGQVLPKQNSNGNKDDVNTVVQPNYWITSLMLDIFAKGNNFGKSFDTVHDGSLTSTKGFGGYYYLADSTVCIVNGGGFDHLWRCNILTNRAWQTSVKKWYLYGARLMYKKI